MEINHHNWTRKRPKNDTFKNEPNKQHSIANTKMYIQPRFCFPPPLYGGVLLGVLPRIERGAFLKDALPYHGRSKVWRWNEPVPLDVWKEWIVGCPALATVGYKCISSPHNKGSSVSLLFCIVLFLMGRQKCFGCTFLALGLPRLGLVCVVSNGFKMSLVWTGSPFSS